MREGLVGQVDTFDERGQQRRGLRAVQRDRRPLFGGGGQPDVQVRPFGLKVVLHHVHHARRAAGRRGDVEPVLRQATDHPVVADEAVVAAEKAIAAAARRELGPRVGVHAVHEFDRIRPHDLDLAKRRGVEDADRGTRRHAFATHGGIHVLARFREVPRPAPLADRLEHRAVLLGPGIDPCLPRHLEMCAAMVACEGPERGRRIRRPKRRQADLRLFLSKGIRGDVQAVDVRHLALVGRHAVRGIALDVLDRAHPLAHGQAQVLGGHVVLIVDEGLGLSRVQVGRQLGVADAGAGPVGGDRIRRNPRRFGRARRPRRGPCRRRRSRPPRRPRDLGWRRR